MTNSMKRLKNRLERYFKLKTSKSIPAFCSDAGIKYHCTITRILSGERKGVSVETYEKLLEELERIGV